MRLVRWGGLGLLAALLLAGGGWRGAQVLTDQKPQAKPEKDSRFGKFIYPGAKTQREYQKEGVPVRTVIFTTEDDPDKVINWYKGAIPRLPPGVVEGVGVDGGGEPYRETAFAVSDSRSKDATARSVTIWVATARISTKKAEDYTLTVVVTRGKDEALTEITLAWLAGPQIDKS